MASNFKIFVQRTGQDIHVKLKGDFDGSSAHELINLLESYAGKSARIVVHTSSISSIHPFGLDVFQKKCGVNGLNGRLMFKGKHKKTLAPLPGSSS